MNDVEVSIPRKAFLPVYHHLLDSTADINFLWGGRDSGKSHFIAQQLIVKCLNSEYFRCILVKSTFASIQSAQWQTIKDVAEQWGVDHLFRFKTSPLSIECVNGNKFLARGCDDPGNLKSIKDPTDAWYEEGNQLSLSEFITVATTLRSNRAKVQQWFSFNPECEGDYNEFWLYKTFFSDDRLTFNDEWRVKVGEEEIVFTYTSTHTTYKDNKYCTSQRRAFLEHLALLDPYYHTVFTKGLWGNIKTDDPYCFAYSREKHVAPVTLDRRLEVKLSFDFNVNPITCGVYQDWDVAGVTYIRVVESIKKENSDIYKILDYIIAKYFGCMFMVTGDATGKNTTALVQDGINYYTVIKDKLNLGSSQLKVPSVNPIVKENRLLVNTAFTMADIKADPEAAAPLIFDWQFVSVDDLGKIDKGNRANPKKRSDHLDNFRYYLNAFHRHLLRT